MVDNTGFPAEASQDFFEGKKIGDLLTAYPAWFTFLCSVWDQRGS